MLELDLLVHWRQLYLLVVPCFLQIEFVPLRNSIFSINTGLLLLVVCYIVFNRRYLDCVRVGFLNFTEIPVAHSLTCATGNLIKVLLVVYFSMISMVKTVPRES